MPASSRSKRRGLLAAPIVVTAIFGPACESHVYTNPGPPEQPSASATEPPTDPTVSPTVSPTAAAPASAVASTHATNTVATGQPSAVASLPPGPSGVPGTLRKLPDGTCAFEFPPPSMDCEPGEHCNPGPPRAPIKVKCPDGKGR
jgi:hypothetical protein